MVGRGNRRSIATAAINNPALRTEVIHALAHIVQNEMKVLCSDKYDSILRLKTKPSLEQFSWETVWLELMNCTPTLTQLMLCILPKSKQGTKAVRPSLCMCASILLKHRNNRINLVQSVVSMIMKAGHATKQVKHIYSH